jgi:hypothetical protein
VSPIAEEWRVSGVDFLAGTLGGARLTIPPGGRHYVDVQIRPTLQDPSTSVPVSYATTWGDLPAIMGADDWTTLDPALTWYDLRLLGVS